MQFDIYTGLDGKPYVRPKNNIKYSFRSYLRDLNACTGVSEAMGRIVLNHLQDFLAKAMKEGASVNIEGLGIFAPSLTIVDNKEDGKITGKRGELSRITVRPAVQLKQKASIGTEFHRTKYSSYQKVIMPDKDQRKDILLGLFKTKKLITSSDYVNAAQVCRTQAYTDLEDFVKGGVIQVHHAGRNKMYSLPEN